MKGSVQILHWLLRLEDRISALEEERTPPESKLDRLIDTVEGLKTSLENLMAVAQDLKTQIAAINEATNANAASLDAVKANITQLAARIKNSMTDEEVADLKASLDGLATLTGAESNRLKDLAKDPTQPVPPEPPALTQARAAVKKS